MRLRSSTDFVGPVASRKKPSKLLEIFGTVAVALITATATIYGYHASTTLHTADKINERETENRKMDIDLSKTFLQLQDKRIEKLEEEIKAVRSDVDLWRNKYYKVVEVGSTLQETTRALQEKYDLLFKEYQELKKKVIKESP